MVSGWKRKAVAAWLGVAAEQACETWPAIAKEMRYSNAKGVKSWGVVSNGSD